MSHCPNTLILHKLITDWIVLLRGCRDRCSTFSRVFLFFTFNFPLTIYSLLSHPCPAAWWDRETIDNTRLTAFVPPFLRNFEKNFSYILKNTKYCKQWDLDRSPFPTASGQDPSVNCQRTLSS